MEFILGLFIVAAELVIDVWVLTKRNLPLLKCRPGRVAYGEAQLSNKHNLKLPMLPVC